MSVTGTSILALAALAALLAAGRCYIHDDTHDHHDHADHDHGDDPHHNHDHLHHHKHVDKRQAGRNDVAKDTTVMEAADPGSDVTPPASKSLSRHKRDLSQLCELIHFHTNESCMDFLNYGCYCGKVKNNGAPPVDRIDRCCLAHHECSVRANKKHCRSPYGSVIERVFHAPETYFVQYKLDCAPSTKRTHLCKCKDSDKLSCAYQTCTCDLQLARCLRRRRRAGWRWQDQYRWSKEFSHKSQRCGWNDDKYCSDVCMAEENNTTIYGKNIKNEKQIKHEINKSKAVEKPVTKISIKDVDESLNALSANTPLHRHRRHLYNLCDVVEKHNPKDKHWASWLGKGDCWAFMNYGCFCGSGGADPETGRPVDKLDKCCKDHDVCYGLMQANCKGSIIGNYWGSKQTATMLQPYNYKCREEDAGTKWAHMCKCDEADKAGCRYRKCDCDLRFARCLRRQRDMGVHWMDKFAWKNGFDPKNDPICGPKSKTKRPKLHGEQDPSKCDCSKYGVLAHRKKDLIDSSVVDIDRNYVNSEKYMYSVNQHDNKQSDETTTDSSGWGWIG